MGNCDLNASLCNTGNMVTKCFKRTRQVMNPGKCGPKGTDMHVEYLYWYETD
jgi:hypothetical protein